MHGSLSPHGTPTSGRRCGACRLAPVLTRSANGRKAAPVEGPPLGDDLLVSVAGGGSTGRLAGSPARSVCLDGGCRGRRSTRRLRPSSHAVRANGNGSFLHTECPPGCRPIVTVHRAYRLSRRAAVRPSELSSGRLGCLRPQSAHFADIRHACWLLRCVRGWFAALEPPRQSRKPIGGD